MGSVLQIVDYVRVLDHLRSAGFRSNYHNSGSFSFPDDVTVSVAGWISGDDPTIRPEAAAQTRTVPQEELAFNLKLAWARSIPGPAWIMPVSHWHYELNFGSSDWLPEVLETLGVPWRSLAEHADASAIEFTPDDDAPFLYLTRELVQRLEASDFTVAFPESPVLCTIHHHRQLWWMSSRAALIAEINATRPRRNRSSPEP